MVLKLLVEAESIFGDACKRYRETFQLPMPDPPHKINPRSLERGRRGGGVKLTLPLDFFGFKFLLLNRLSKALAKLFLVCEYIF